MANTHNKFLYTIVIFHVENEVYEEEIIIPNNNENKHVKRILIE